MPPATARSRSPARTAWSTIPAERSPEAHTLLTVSEETSFGMPALIWAWRLGIWPCPACSTCPKTRCSTCSGATSARSSAAAMAVPPRSVASREARPPPIFPNGVRAAPRITVLGICGSPLRGSKTLPTGYVARRRLSMRRALVIAMAALALSPGAASAQGVDLTCQFALTRLDHTTTNVLALDTNAVYWSSHYVAVPGSRIRIEGEFPYVPDRGRDAKGGVPLPKVSLHGSAPGIDQCRETQAPYLPTPSGPALPDPTDDGSGYPGRNPPNWRLFENLCGSAIDILLDNEDGEAFHPDARERCGDGPGFFANRDIAYVFTGTSRGFGELLVLRGRAPTFANTRPGPRRMPSGKQLRYFSFCQYEPATQRVIDCASDDRVPVRRGRFKIVVS